MIKFKVIDLKEYYLLRVFLMCTLKLIMYCLIIKIRLLTIIKCILKDHFSIFFSYFDVTIKLFFQIKSSVMIKVDEKFLTQSKNIKIT